jgi:hypothetical protein
VELRLKKKKLMGGKGFGTQVKKCGEGLFTEHWYCNPEVSGSSSGSVKFSLPDFSNSLQVYSE